MVLVVLQLRRTSKFAYEEGFNKMALGHHLDVVNSLEKRNCILSNTKIEKYPVMIRFAFCSGPGGQVPAALKALPAASAQTLLDNGFPDAQASIFT